MFGMAEFEETTNVIMHWNGFRKSLMFGDFFTAEATILSLDMWENISCISSRVRKKLQCPPLIE